MFASLLLTLNLISAAPALQAQPADWSDTNPVTVSEQQAKEAVEKVQTQQAGGK